MDGRDPEYALDASSPVEHDRLIKQSARLVDFTERLLRRARVSEGMRVLDLGCGTGDVSFVAAELVGSSGAVVGIDRDEAVIEKATKRAADRKLTNVEFVADEIWTADIGPEPFDAIVGRFVLAHVADPAGALRRLASCLRPGGVVAFIETNIPDEKKPYSTGPAVWPANDEFDRVTGLIREAWYAAGTPPLMGLQLPYVFHEAGLIPDPEMEGTVWLNFGRGFLDQVQAQMRSMLPYITAHGLATEEEVSADNIVERVVNAAPPLGPVMQSLVIVSAWGVKPL